jgi:hypothetical protein
VRYDTQAPWAWLKQSGVNVYLQGQSGRAYTPIDLNSSVAAEPFSKNALFQTTCDVKVNHFLRIGGQRLDLSLAGINVFGNRIIYRVDQVTGRGRVWGVGQYDPTNFPDVNDYTKVSEVDDPSNYGPPATWRFAIDYDF